MCVSETRALEDAGGARPLLLVVAPLGVWTRQRTLLATDAGVTAPGGAMSTGRSVSSGCRRAQGGVAPGPYEKSKQGGVSTSRAARAGAGGVTFSTRNGFLALDRLFCTFSALPGEPAAANMAAYCSVATSLSLPSAFASRACAALM